MFIQSINESYKPQQHIEVTVASNNIESSEVVTASQESPKKPITTQNVFELQATAKKAAKDSEVPSDIKKVGYFENLDADLYEDAEAIQLNSYYFDYDGDLKKYLFVWTLLKTATGSFEGFKEGTQEIYYNKKVISTSTKFEYILKNGEPTVQHWHKHFCVETNRFGQTLTYLK